MTAATNRWQATMTLGLLVAAMLALPGCLAVVAAAGTGAGVAYVRGDTEGMVRAEPAEVLEAARAVMRDMSIYVTDTQTEVAPDGSRIQLKGRTINDDPVKITAERRGEGISKVWVRVGIFGDQMASNSIYHRIERRLTGDAPR